MDVEGARRVSDAMLAALMDGRRRLARRDGRLVVPSEQRAVRAALNRTGPEIVDGLER